jgi:hypothetical protein
MIKKFNNFVNENYQDTNAKNLSEMVLINNAVYDIARRAGIHIQFLISDRDYIKFIIPSSFLETTSNFIDKLKTVLDDLGISYQEPIRSYQEAAKGDDQFLKVSYHDMVSYGENFNRPADYVSYLRQTR